MPGGATPRFAKPKECAQCALERIGFGFAPPSGPIGARLTFIGEALGYEEAIVGEPFYGSAGGVLSRICIRAGISRAHCRIANVVSCRPPGDYLAGAAWEDMAIAHCRQYLQPVIDSVPNGGVIVTLGAIPLGAVLGLSNVPGVTVKDFHGTVHEIKRPNGTMYYVVCTYHPSHLQRGAMKLLDVVTEDFKLADRISQHGFKRSPAELVVDPPVEWLHRWCADHLERVRRDPDGTHLSTDTEFLEKAGGADESEVTAWNAQSPITRVNGGNDNRLGWTVPHVGSYVDVLKQFFKTLGELRGWMWLWNKYADVDHLRAHDYQLQGIVAIDGMWLWHHIQTDLPRGLGFVAPMASDFGAWKHWAKVKEKEGPYAAADGLQNWRTCMWVMAGAVKLGQWDMFMRDWHERDEYVLRPAFEMGVPINRTELVAFHEDLQRKLASVLERIKQTLAKGVLKPKDGYAKRPKGLKCPDCDGHGVPADICGYCGGLAKDRICQNYGCEGKGETEFVCATCVGSGEQLPKPPASIIGKSKKVGGEAKLQYMTEGVRLVEITVEVDVRICQTCHKEDVGPKHKCAKPKRPRVPKQRRRVPANVEGDAGQAGTASEADAAAAPVSEGADQRDQPAVLTTERRPRARWFWQLPFNPDAPAQILAYLEQQGIEAPVDRKRGTKTTNKKALADLAVRHRDDPFFQLQLDWKAVQKVDATYAVGTLNRLDVNDRVHPEIKPVPATLRDSCVNPNLQNVVADKAGADGLAAGFRRCIEAPDALPPGVSDEEYQRWQEKWT